MILPDSKLNKKAQDAILLPNFFLRIEECVINARTDLAKRRLVQASIVLGAMKVIEEEMVHLADWTPLL